MLASLWLPILLSTIALFFASFLSWMVLPFHRRDWRKLPREDELISALRECDIPAGNYMFPAPEKPADHKNEEFQRKYQSGPKGVMTVFGQVNMGANLGLTIVYFLVISICLAYLATLALKRGAEFLAVFRFVTTAGLLTFLPAIVQHSIWFRNRIVGHILESILYAITVGGIFAALWPQ